MSYLLITVNWLDNRFHGLFDRNGPQEWPPSPYRLFQAIVAGVAKCGVLEEKTSTLDWLQSQKPPIIITKNVKYGNSFTRYVPNNDGDEKFERQNRLTGKITMPMILLDKPEIHYVWEIESCCNLIIEHIREAVRTLYSLGWGIDMAFADARIISKNDLQGIPGYRWIPRKGVWRENGMLRIPIIKGESKDNTLSDLKYCYSMMESRIVHGKPLRIIDTPSVFDYIFWV